MEANIEKTVEEIFKELPSAIKAALITRNGTLIYSNIEENTLRKILKISKKHQNIPINDYKSEKIDENTLIFYGLSSDKIFITYSMLTLPETIVHSRKVIEKLKKKLNEILRKLLEELGKEVNQETKQKYKTIYELSPKYKSIDEVLPIVRWMGETAATIVANLDKKLPIWQLTLLLQKAGIKITFQETQKILEFLHKRGYVTPRNTHLRK